MYEISNQKELDKLLKYDSLDLNQFGINRFGDKRVLLKGSSYVINCSSRLIKSLPKIDFIGEDKTIVKLHNTERGYSIGSGEEVSVFSPNYGFTFNNVFITSEDYLEIVFTDREDLKSWENVRFDTSVIGVYILLEEIRKFQDFLNSYNVNGVLSAGDHVVVDRGLYTHHGVYIGNNTLIHYSGEPGVSGKITKIKLEDFAKNDTFWILEYEEEESLPPNEIISRAKSRLGEEKYDVVFNNCEHFANWCCTGIDWSNQIAGFAIGSVLGYAAASLANDGVKKYRLKK